MRNILVVPCGTEIAHELIRSLKDIKNINVFGVNSVECYTDLPLSNVFSDAPLIDDESFIDYIADKVVSNQITHIIPAHDSAALKLTEFAHFFSAKVVSSSYSTNIICRSKRLTYNTLKDKVLVPKLYGLNDDLNFPLFVKPDVGQGSNGVRKITSSADLNLSEGELLCEYLSGPEFTVDCVTDSNGQLLFAKARQRSVTRNGISVETELVKSQQQFYEFAKKINENIQLRGGWFFQVKENAQRELCLLEVSTRIAGSMITSRFNGINFTELSILISDNIPVSVIDNQLDVKLYRNLAYQFKTNLSYNVIYTDYDDCLLLDNSRVNSDLIKFLFDAINNGKKVVLITRHAGNLQQSLKQFRLSFIFDEIIHITDSEKPKSTFITHSDAIFIDDSFKERKDVSSKLGIPCFSVDMIRGLCCLQS
ncbi:ATP-grasp domain-containing protein [Shewanella xiamenensis]|uniref:ATP-grasp domain-containing protein n=1 Tax=Shewanella TaxID=22 RepID=UPI0021DA38AA|nr:MULTISPECIES: ATP-grasp domain-containing protein [Shewanella]MCU8040296.1 ATP-grasp domain-containing protein [Shewanella sp. SM69]MDH1314310.1 ATP-grasp domain-containing protein [Shewanella xiamenensis]